MEKTKSILHDILSSLEDDYKVSDIRTCVYWTAVTSLRCGLASTMAASLFHSEGHQVVYAGNLLPTGAKELARLSLSSRTLEAAIGIATINSMLLIDESLLSASIVVDHDQVLNCICQGANFRQVYGVCKVIIRR